MSLNVIRNSTTPKYQTLLFDADETLLDFKRSEHEALFDALSAHSIECNDEIAAIYSEINADMWRRLERGEIDKISLRTERFRLFAEHRGYSCDYVALANTYETKLSEKSYVKDGAKEICRLLRPYCKMYIVTNGIKRIQTSRFHNSGLEKYFDGVFISEDIGFEKPDINYFLNVEKRIGGLEKSSALIIGDSLTSDMKGGIAYGIDTCFVNPHGKEIPADMNITYNISSLSEIEKIVLGDSQ